VAPKLPGTSGPVNPKLFSVAAAATVTEIVPAVSVVVANNLLKSAPPVKSEFVADK
jgi:hypothetical protein